MQLIHLHKTFFNADIISDNKTTTCKGGHCKGTTPTTTSPSSIKPSKCTYPSRLCDNGTICVTVDQLCDSKYDCVDLSDEGLRCGQFLNCYNILDEKECQK